MSASVPVHRCRAWPLGRRRHKLSGKRRTNRGLGEVSEAHIIQFSRDKLASYKRPRSVVFASALPATSTGKITRRSAAESVEPA